MKSPLRMPLVLCLVAGACSAFYSQAAERVVISGELKQWHKVTLTIAGPAASETGGEANPFTDFRMEVQFQHESGTPSYRVPGYFAADGDAANSSATSGDKWRAHLSPDKTGTWSYRVAFHRGRNEAVGAGGEPVQEVHGLNGAFEVLATDKATPDFRSRGRLQYVNMRYLRFAGTGDYFLKAGPDSPENLLAYVDFDGTQNAKLTRIARPGEALPAQLKTWEPHVKDWREGDSVWKGEKGKGLIGALNYIASQGCNAFSFLTYNAGGDGDDVWPFVARDEKLRYDCSKLDQWQIVFDHATRLGLFCHFKTQETELDDLKGPGAKQSLDGGDLGLERKLYYRELIARFGYLLALNWNLGEENTQSPEQQKAAAQYFQATDPYRHLVVVHTYPDQQDKVYPPLLGAGSGLTGASLQNGWANAHQRVLKWIRESAKAGLPWVVAHDEQNPASLGVPPDPGYEGFNGLAREKETDKPYTLHDIRKQALWGTLMAGGAGVEYYFGYTLPQNDLGAQDWRSRERSWTYCRIALKFFRDNKIPFWEMQNADELVGNEKHDNSRYCLAKDGGPYLVYLPKGGSADLRLSGTGTFKVNWFNPRSGGPLRDGRIKEVAAGASISLGEPPSEPEEDWVILVRKSE